MFQDLSNLWPLVRAIVVVLMLGLPLMAGLCIGQAARNRRIGDDAMARSWADAARSFGGMMVASWLLAWAGWLAYLQGAQFLAGFQTGGR